MKSLKIILKLNTIFSMAVLSFPFFWIWCGWRMGFKVFLTGAIGCFLINKIQETLEKKLLKDRHDNNQESLNKILGVPKYKRRRG